MTPDAIAARRALIRAYQSYLEAEDELEHALENAARYVPELRQHGLRPLGTPGSRIRRLQDSRSHSVEVLGVLREKHKRAVVRMSAQKDAAQGDRPPERLR